MSKEKMAELKIKIPERWLDFIEEFYQVTGEDRDEELKGWVKAMIEIPMIEDDLLSANDRIRLVEKYQLTDICKIPQWVRDETAGIPRKVKPISPWEAVINKLVDNPKFKETYVGYMKHAPAEAMIKAMEVLSPEEMAEVRAAAPSA